jgi:asparagine synthase (glutamine-hydrolysing)
LDSGSIACLIRLALGPDAAYHIFSGRFPGQAADEGPYMDSVAAQIKPIRHDVDPTPARLLDELGHFAWMNELPVDSASQYAQWCVFRSARDAGVTVLLDGQGADEILGGYEPYFLPYLRTNPDDRDIVRSRYPGLLERRHPGGRNGMAFRMRRGLAQALNRGSDIAFGIGIDTGFGDQPLPATLHQALRTDTLDGFLGTLLRYGDRNSMAHSVEVRLPFCDHRIFEWVQSLPPDFLMGDGQTKRLLREAMRGILPETIRTRWRKQGFVPPQDAWMDQGLLDAARTLIHDPAFARSAFWRPRWWQRVIDRFQAGERSLAAPLWKVLATEAWRMHFLARIAGQRRHPPLLAP